MDIALFDYNLPSYAIAQAPVRPRERAKMLYFERGANVMRDHTVAELPTLLRAGDLLVFNVSRVRAARIPEAIIKSADNNIKEILILKPLNESGRFECLIRGKNVEIGEKITIHCHSGEQSDSRILPNDSGNGQNKEITITISDRIEDPALTRFVIQVKDLSSEEFLQICEEIGQLPLPPYIHNPQLLGHEQELYQPILARELGSVAAPTASLHFSEKLFDELKMKGVRTAEVVLHVGLGTFLPVRVQNTDDHTMHAEEIEVTQALVSAILETKRNGGRVIAVGTTVARALESAAMQNRHSGVGRNPLASFYTGNVLAPYFGETSLFMQPGYQFKVIDGLMTNFHMPKSTLLMMVSAFIGREELFGLYNHALESNYRFLSFGDCMLLV